MPNFGHLPAELIHSIVEELWPDFQTLAGCALVCRSWHLPAQTQRFRRIDLSYHTDCHLFHDILTNSPYIRPLIKNISFSPLDLIYGISAAEATSASEYLFAVVSLLTKIQKLYLTGSRSRRWDEIPLSFRDSIVILLRMPSLTSLELELWDFHSLELRHLFLLPVSLMQLMVRHVEVLKDGTNEMGTTDKESSALSRARPRELIINEPTRELWSWLLHPGAPVDLRSVNTIEIYTACYSPSKLLELTASSLEVFHLQYVWTGLVDFSLNSILTTLHLDVLLARNAINLKAFLPAWLEISIATFPDNSRLEILHIDLNFYVGDADDPPFKKDDWVHDPAWNRFASVLASSKFAFLKRVEVVPIGLFLEADHIQGIKDAFHPLGSKLLINPIKFRYYSHKRLDSLTRFSLRNINCYICEVLCYRGLIV